jgi:hypothetical protein
MWVPWRGGLVAVVGLQAMWLSGCQNTTTERDAQRDQQVRETRGFRQADDAQRLRETQDKFRSEQARKEYVSQAEKRLTEADRTIDRLNRQTHTAAPDRKNILQQKMNAVREHRDHARDRLKELKAADSNSWFQKHGVVERELQDLSNALKMPE